MNFFANLIFFFSFRQDKSWPLFYSRIINRKRTITFSIVRMQAFHYMKAMVNIALIFAVLRALVGMQVNHYFCEY